ncbi:hypothetical protein SteCoe_32128 [Stentor coeruleus]|uniref:Cilia- and flagella-associated protein 58 central coiled coil domain-containing protein n=1 Tax=Stentor coeruleus TaxID=5963 RepID=A0A1R2AZQ8_9CILI|nr:hypothetical protein SteCoe_32128 [Stentor coeruleus]
MANQDSLSPGKGKIDDEFESRDFQVLETEFQTVLKEIGGDKQLEHFHKEYEKHYRILLASHENEKKLIKKCKELNSHITESTLKVQQAFKLSQEENENIRNFQADLDRAVKTLENFKAKEDNAKKTISALREEIERLSLIVEQGSGLAVGQDSTVNELIRSKDELTKEVSLISENISKSQKEHSELLAKIQKLESLKTSLREEVTNANREIEDMKRSLDAESKKKGEIETELNTEKGKFEGIIDKIKKKEEIEREFIEEKKKVAKVIQDVDDDKQLKEEGLKKAQSDKKIAEDKTIYQENIKENIENAIGEVDRNILKATNDLESLKDLKDRHERELDLLTTKELLSTEEKKNAEILREKARNHMHSLIKESESLRKNTESDQNLIENLKRERDMITKTVMRARDNVRAQEDTSITMDNNKKKLENEIKKYSKDIKKLKDKVWQLQKEQERYGIEKSQAYAKYSQCLEEVKLCNSVIAELQKKNIEAEAKLKQQMNLYEAVRSDRNLYSKNLIESHDEIDELDKKKKIMVHQINQLKEEIVIKDTELIQENKQLGILEKRHDELDSAKIKLEEKQKMLEKTIKDSERENQRLKYVITEVEQEKAKQKKELELVTNERDILGTQLIRRKDELELLYKKIKILTSTLQKGEEQYKQRLGDINILKIKIAELKQKLHSAKKEASVVFDLKKEMYYLEREVLDEKVKVKALSEEVENTMNVHRWRKVEGTEPEIYELITKIQTLQRRLISKNEESLQKKKELDALEENYNKLKISLARHPGPESAEKIDECRRILEEKKVQMNNMEEELELYQTQSSQYKHEIERLNRELQEVKKNYFTIKKKEQLIREQELKADGRDKPVIRRHPPPQRFTGGGFNLAI